VQLQTNEGVKSSQYGFYGCAEILAAVGPGARVKLSNSHNHVSGAWPQTDLNSAHNLFASKN